MVEPDDVYPNHHIAYQTTGLTPAEDAQLYACMVLWETASQHRVKFINVRVADDKDIDDKGEVLNIARLNVNSPSLLAISSLGYHSKNNGNYILFDEFNNGLILHELGHTLGLLDAVLRPDSIQYIKRADNNPLPSFLSIPFDKLGYEWYKYPFDYYSVMLYPGSSGFVKKDGSPLPVQKSEDMMISLTDARIVFDIYSDTRDQYYTGNGYEYDKD
jgi:hypothetical protein